MPEMTEERSWEEFRNSGLAWWINRSLHVFGWALVFEVDDASKPLDEQKVTRCYPAHCKFRGFGEESETRGFKRLTTYIESALGRMKEAVQDD